MREKSEVNLKYPLFVRIHMNIQKGMDKDQYSLKQKDLVKVDDNKLKEKLVTTICYMLLLHI